MAIPIRRRIPGKGFQKAVIGLLNVSAVLAAGAMLFIIALDGWNADIDLFLTFMALGIAGFFLVMGYVLKAMWAEREKIAKETGQPVPDQV